MMVMMVMASTANCIRQILDVRKLVVLRCIGEVRRKLIQLVRRRRVSVLLSGLGGVLQIGGDLLGDLLVLGRIRLLKLL